MSVLFIDTETTGLDPDRHEMWDLAIIDASGREFVYHFRPNLRAADPMALRIGQYYERTSDPKWQWSDPRFHAADIARRLDGTHLVGAIPWFDAEFLRRWLDRWDEKGTWHYHHIDIEALAVGYLAAKGEAVDLPYHSKDLSRRIGVDPDQFEAHTALGDARWAKAVYEKIVGAAV